MSRKRFLLFAVVFVLIAGASLSAWALLLRPINVLVSSAMLRADLALVGAKGKRLTYQTTRSRRPAQQA